MPLYYNWFQFNGVVQGASLRSLVHPHRLTRLNYYLQVTASLFHGFSFSQIIKSLCQCLSKWYFSLIMDMRENSSQWDMEFWWEKVLRSISPSWQKLEPLLPLSPGFLTLPSVLTQWQEQWQLLCDQVERAGRLKGHKPYQHWAARLAPVLTTQPPATWKASRSWFVSCVWAVRLHSSR